MNKTYEAYLAGGKYSEWRDYLIKALAPSLNGYDPFQDSNQSAAFRFVANDLASIDQSDLVIAYYPGVYISHGMAAEIGYATAREKQIFYVDESDAPDMFLVGCSKRFFPSLDALIQWWKGREERGVSIL